QYSNDGDGRDGDPTDAGDNTVGFSCPSGVQTQRNTWHGTRVASVLGAITNHGQDIAGVDWSARIQPLRVSGRCGALLSDTV
ncbi:S8 family serine peptidase, partial [Acinetobacter baumannii]